MALWFFQRTAPGSIRRIPLPLPRSRVAREKFDVAHRQMTNS